MTSCSLQASKIHYSWCVSCDRDDLLTSVKKDAGGSVIPSALNAPTVYVLLTSRIQKVRGVYYKIYGSTEFKYIRSQLFDLD